MSGAFHAAAVPWLAVLAAALPVLVLAASLLMSAAFMRGGEAQRTTGKALVFAAAGFALLDALLLKALPWLGLSFGPIMFSLVLLLICRAAGYVLFGALCIWRGQIHPCRPSLFLFLVGNLALTLLVLYGFYFEPFQLQATRRVVQVPSGKLSSPIRIVQISDLHVERTTVREKALIPLVNNLHPDLIVMTGDYLNLSYLSDATAMRDAKELISQLHAPYGVYAVNGSVDNAERMASLFSGSAVTVLDDQITQVHLPGGELHVIGVSNWGTDHDMEMVQRLTARVPDTAYRLLLFHTPDAIQAAAASGIDLYLAGHTHGGQICLPVYGAIVTASIYKKTYESGLYQVNSTTLYVSRGIGMEGGIAPRARFLAPPEVVVIDLIPGD